MNFCFLWAIRKKLPAPPIHYDVFDLLVHWQSFPNFARRGRINSSNFDPILGKTNRIRSSATLPPHPNRYVSPFSKLRFFKWTMTNPTKKRKSIYYLRLADPIKPMLSTCQKEVNYHWFSCDSGRPMGVRHVWGRSVKCLESIVDVSFTRLTPSLCSLFFAHLSARFRFFRVSFWKRLLSRLDFKFNIHVNMVGDPTDWNFLSYWRQWVYDSMWQHQRTS